MKKIIEDADEKSQPLADYISEKRKTNSRKLKDMVKKGQLENIDEQIEKDDSIKYFNEKITL